MRNVSYARQIVLSATVREANRIIFCFPHAIVLRGSYSYLLWRPIGLHDRARVRVRVGTGAPNPIGTDTVTEISLSMVNKTYLGPGQDMHI
jgi:hypothetical protein